MGNENLLGVEMKNYIIALSLIFLSACSNNAVISSNDIEIAKKTCVDQGTEMSTVIQDEEVAFIRLVVCSNGKVYPLAKEVKGNIRKGRSDKLFYHYSVTYKD